jgi:hypothetical protein
MITPSQDQGYNFATSFGAARINTDTGSGNGRFIAGLFSCNGTPVGDVHFNLGHEKQNGSSGQTTYGVALEKSFGAITPHIEVFGGHQADTSVDVGIRGDISRNVQLDGSARRADGSTFYTLGLKFRF